MKILFVTDLHGNRWKYDRLLELAKHHGVKALVNGGDMLPKDGDLFEQDRFITGYLKNHFAGFNDSEIHYLNSENPVAVILDKDRLDVLIQMKPHLHMTSIP